MRKYFHFICVLLGTAACVRASGVQQSAESPVNSTNVGDRAEKFLSLFTVVRFGNSMCTASSGYNGTCMTSAECSAGGGTGTGSCASGFGVCCVFTYTTCGQTSSRNFSYWQNPGGASTTYNQVNQCTFNVKKCSSSVCQVRLDFYSFTLNQPDLDGICSVDMFTVSSGSSNSVPIICGENTGQHIYLDVSRSTDTFQLSIITTTANMSRSWNIKATQIPCSDYTNLAPDQCLQYFKETSGTIQSFNYKSVRLSSTATSGTIARQLSNQDYAICIRMSEGFCGVCYTVCPDALNTKSAAFSVTGTQLLNSARAVSFDFNCASDWLQIPCGNDQRVTTLGQSSGTSPTSCVSRICGGIFASSSSATVPAPVYSYRKPFQLHFYTDSTEATSSVTNLNNLGFCLKYVQQPCITLQG